VKKKQKVRADPAAELRAKSGNDPQLDQAEYNLSGVHVAKTAHPHQLKVLVFHPASLCRPVCKLMKKATEQRWRRQGEAALLHRCQMEMVVALLYQAPVQIPRSE
jgi:hypothetical protein